MAFVPIWNGRQVIGVLSILDEPSSAAPSPLEVTMGSSDGVATSVEVLTSLYSLLPLLTVLSDLISLALDNRRLLVQSDRRAQLLGLLTYLASNLSVQALPELTQTLANRLSIVFQVPLATLLLHHQESDELLVLATSDSPLGRLQREVGLDHVPLGTAGALAQVFLTGQPFFANDLEADAHFPTDLREKLELRSAAAVVIEASGSSRGVLLLASTAPEAFAEDDHLFLGLISARLSVLLQEQAWSEELAQVETERLARLEREDFLAAVAHDLKNSLTAMRGNAQLALRRVARGEAASHEPVLKRIADKAAQAIQLVNDLVDVNHIETGAFRLVMEPVELVEFLREELASFQSSFGELATFSFKTDIEQLTIEADRNRLSQVLSNLVTNAVRYSPQGGKIELWLTPPPPPQTPASQTNQENLLPQAAMVIVNDQGIGVAPNERERIFERTVRGRGSDLAAGSGLGLYISREIITRHGGNIWVEGREDQGASFRFTLPASRTHPDDPPPDAK
jgi:signal transduction histidine kinase